MASAHWPLQLAIHQKLNTLPAVLALLGGAHIWDHVPRGASFPYVTFGITSEQDWSTGTEDGGEHILTLHIWSRAAGRHEVDEIADTIRSALHDQPLGLTGHRLVNLRHEFSDARRDAEKELYHGVLRLRAVTEPGI
jgi:hypothetical protein